MATLNAHKAREVNQILPNSYTVMTMTEAEFSEDIPENGSSFEENALGKAQFIFEKTGHSVFGEDSGLMVDALNGEPGIYTARYAGEERDNEKNIDLLLSNLEGIENRKAKFVSCIGLIHNGTSMVFRGEVHGRIALEREGNGGFGYDPVFIPNGYDNSFAVLGEKIKNDLSHRSNALKQMISYLNDTV